MIKYTFNKIFYPLLLQYNKHCYTELWMALLVLYHIVQNVLRAKTFAVFADFDWTTNVFLRISKCFSTCGCCLMQTRKFFCEYSHYDLTAKILSLEVLYYNYGSAKCFLLLNNYVANLIYYNFYGNTEHIAWKRTSCTRLVDHCDKQISH